MRALIGRIMNSPAFGFTDLQELEKVCQLEERFTCNTNLKIKTLGFKEEQKSSNLGCYVKTGMSPASRMESSDS